LRYGYGNCLAAERTASRGRTEHDFLLVLQKQASKESHRRRRDVRGTIAVAVRQEAEGRPMSEAQAFRDLIQRVRRGDEDAATEMVQRYESTIRIAIRVRLDQSDLRRLLDSMDICQS